MNGLPRGWSLARLGEVCLDRVGQGEPGHDPVPYIDIGSIDRASKVIGEAKSVTADTAPSRARQWVREGDVLVSMTRPNLNAVALVRAPLDGAVASTGFDVLRPIGVLSGWVFYRVRSHAFIEDVCKDLQGVVYPAIRPRDVRQHQFPVPPLPEQRRIVAAIEDHFSRLDEAVSLLERVQRNLKRYRASVLKAAVEGRLVPTEAALARSEGRAYEPASALLERILEERRRRWKAEGGRGTYKEPVAPDTTDLPELPEGWCWASIDQVADYLCDGPFGSNLKTEHYTNEGARVVRLQNVGDGRFVDEHAHISYEHYRLLSRHQVEPGDVVVASLGDELPRACLIPEWLGPAVVKADCLRVAVDSGVAVPGFVMNALNSEPVRARTRQLVHGLGRPRIGLGLMRTVQVPLPPLAEQVRIVGAIDEAATVASAFLATTDAILTRCARLRQSILKWAFEGRLADQDPADEPASVLLGRIRAERAATAAPKIARRGRPRRRRAGA